jgi:hypothetical protein
MRPAASRSRRAPVSMRDFSGDHEALSSNRDRARAGTISSTSQRPTPRPASDGVAWRDQVAAVGLDRPRGRSAMRGWPCRGYRRGGCSRPIPRMRAGGTTTGAPSTRPWRSARHAGSSCWRAAAILAACSAVQRIRRGAGPGRGRDRGALRFAKPAKDAIAIELSTMYADRSSCVNNWPRPLNLATGLEHCRHGRSRRTRVYQVWWVPIARRRRREGSVPAYMSADGSCRRAISSHRGMVKTP